MNMRNIIIAFVGFICFSAVAENNLSIHNKSGRVVYVDVQKGEPGIWQKFLNLIVSEGKAIFDGGFYDRETDISEPTYLIFYNKDAKVLAKVRIAPGKTIYVNLDLNKATDKVYPQQGPLKGWTYHTDQGYSLKNNVTAADIKEVK
jgi:hypothetical protein